MSLQVFHDPSEDNLGDLRLNRLWQYWREFAQLSRLPARADIDPSKITPVLPWTFLIDTTPIDGYRYRLVGTQIVADMGYDMTGQLVSRAYAGPDWDDVQRDYRWVIRNKLPCLTRNSVVLRATGQPYAYSRLLLPLSANGEEVDMLIGAAVAVSDTSQTD
jgi:hypothetical protein